MQLRGVGLRFFRLKPSPTLRVRLGFNSKFHKCVGQLELLVGYLAIARTQLLRDVGAAGHLATSARLRQPQDVSLAASTDRFPDAELCRAIAM